MKRQSSSLAGILAGTALALLMGAPAGNAAPPRAAAPAMARPSGATAGLLLVQENGEDAQGNGGQRKKRHKQQAEGDQAGGDDAAPAKRKGGGNDGDNASRKKRAPQQADQAQGGEGESAPRRKRATQQADEGGAQTQPDSGNDNQNKRRKRQSQQADEGQATPAQPAEANDAPSKRDAKRQAAKQQGSEAAQDDDTSPRAGQADDSAPDRKKPKRQEQAGEQPAAKEPAPKNDAAADKDEDGQPKRRSREKNGEAEATKPAPADEDAAQNPKPRRSDDADKTDQAKGDENAKPGAKPRTDRNASDNKGRDGDAASDDEDKPRNSGGKPSRSDDTASRDKDKPDNKNRRNDDDEAKLPPGEAPSADAEQRDAPKGEEPPRRRQRQAEDDGPPPSDDRAAQKDLRPTRVERVDAEQGTRRRRGGDPDDDPRRRERPSGTDVVREIGNRLILRYNNQVLVESDDRPRMTRNARDVYVEDLPQGRSRETVIRRDGTRVVTVRNRYGDVIRRSRILPDGREYVLNYVQEDDTPRVRDWRDPGLDLPPFRPNVPPREYILDSEERPTPDDYYNFLERPPVERVERLYSIDEVKRSSRIRQKTRRVDLDTLTFDFGSDAIPDSEIEKLDGVASAMQRLLKKNPAETFLIEGHTDAVGSDEANLALSDRRAESVAQALSNMFDIPPENLTTQGYGEQYLKVQTAGPERENRRVAIRRITPLVAPVASAQ